MQKGRRVNTESKSERDFSTIVTFSSALGFGAILTLSQALRVSKLAITFHLSIWTAIAFLIGFNSAFAYLRFLFTCGDKTPRLFRRGGLMVLGVVTAGAILYPFRSIQVDKFAERFEGVGAALCFIAIGLVLIWRIVLTAELEEQRQEAEEHNLLQGGRAVDKTL